MCKYLGLFTVSLSILLFAFGCDKQEPEAVESPRSDSREVNTVEQTTEVPRKDIKKGDYFHDKCSYIFSTFVNEDGLVDYKGLKRKKVRLRALLSDFDELDHKEYDRWSRHDQIAFWINAYNVQMLDIITSNYPIKASRLLLPFPGYGPDSIKHIKGIWDEKKFIVMDEEFTLADIYRRFFREEFGEPKVIFALSLASISSPPLRNEPYYGHKLNEQLDEQVKRVLSDRNKFKIDKKGKKVYLPGILTPSWYGKDFVSKYGTVKKYKDKTPTERAVLNFVANYLNSKRKNFLETKQYSVKYIKHNWNINDNSKR
ncbi:DUF547 domain-containing protein [Planctomycetota bacterium]